MLKMTIDNEEVLSDNDISIKEEILSPSSTILNNVYPKSWELDKDYTSRFYYPKDYSKLNIQNFTIEPEEAGKTIQINGSATLNDVDTSKESRVLRILGQTSQTGTPSPSSPIPINVVSGDNTIDICGKNLLDIPDGTNTSGGLTVTRSNGKITFVGTATSTYPNTGGFSFMLKPGTYTISSTNNDYDFYLWFRNSNSDLINSANLLKGTKTINVTSNDITTLVIGVENLTTGTAYNIETSIQIEKGSTATTYEPYIGNSYPLYLGVENLWKNQLSGFLPSNGSYPTTNSSYPNAKYVIVPLLAGQKLTFSGSTSASGRVRYINKDTNQVVGTIINTGDNDSYCTSTGNFQDGFKNATITAKKDFLVGIMDLYSANLDLIVNYGSTPQHISTTPIELCKIGTYQDYIYKEDGSWYLHKEIGKVVLNGSENWQLRNTSTQGTKTYSLAEKPNNYLLQSTTTSPGGYAICDKFVVNRTVYGASDMWGLLLNIIGISFYYSTGTQRYMYINTTEDLPTYLASNNATLYYILSTPTNTEITDTLLLEQLESLSS